MSSDFKSNILYSSYIRYMKTMISVFITSLIAISCVQKNDAKQSEVAVNSFSEKESVELSKFTEATFAAGCFWCVEGVFESVKGVEEAVSGYAGGEEKNPTYEQVGGGRTSHAEAVKVYYDSSVVDYPTLLKVFFASQDPTQVDGQGPDHGRQYRSIIFYRNENEKQIAEEYIAELNASGRYDAPIAAEIVPYTEFWLAEDYHQDYIQKHPSDNNYVLYESIPRIKEFQIQFPELIKPEKNLLDK